MKTMYFNRKLQYLSHFIRRKLKLLQHKFILFSSSADRTPSIWLDCLSSVVHLRVHDQKFVRSSTLKLISAFIFRIRPWCGRSRVKNKFIRPPSNDNLGPTSEFVREMDCLSPNFGPLITWTDGRADDPQTAVYDREGLITGKLGRGFIDVV